MDYWQDVLSNNVAPHQIRVPGSNVRGRIDHADIGPVSVMNLRTSAIQARRTPDLIEKSDQGMFKIDLAIGGEGLFEQEGRESQLAPGEFILMDLARPSNLVTEKWQELSVVMFPRHLLPVGQNQFRELTAVRFAAADPYAALVAALTRELVKHLDSYESARDARIGTAFLDLLSLAVANRIDRVSAVPLESRENAMKIKVQAFIQDHLGDPQLSPATIAAAHHISTRTLHKLFEGQQHTVAASIRRQRLERCHQDLLDPRLRDHPVSAIGARWGFHDAAGFSRTFRAVYGVPPSEYRTIQTTISTPTDPHP
ncbi:helix-turn-helix domain-containing protein [Nocardia sp. NBC_01499]|uniref:AraC-like ligand-binding domain-containing protein n=1 Tax=Nocardia sp. NBC_01499 TaxID=2903597 RepID=UPI0038676A38